jgi:phage N-6-adenine-methyltransferase
MTVTKAKQANTSTEWATPKALYDKLDRRFHFTLDPCATAENAKCPRFFTKEDDGLRQSWAGERVFMNPPYGKETPVWVKKAREESFEHKIPVVCLVVPRTDTAWFQDLVRYAEKLWLLRGRVRFENPGNPGQSPQDPSCIVVFNGYGLPNGPELKLWDWKNDECP